LWNERLEGTLALYQIERQDVVGTPVPGVLQNTGNWRARGVESSLRLRPVTWVELYASYTYREPLISQDRVTPANEGNDIAFIPRHLAKAGIGWLPTKALRLDVTGRYVGESFADPANTIRLPDYMLIEAAISYQWKNLNVAVFATNLLDEEYYADVFSSGTVVNGSAFEGTPRTFGVRVKAVF
jgi:iron complex outermembrane receptor protein